MESINELPNHLVALIMQQLPIDERCRCCVVSKAFNTLNSHLQLGPALHIRPQQVNTTYSTLIKKLCGNGGRNQVLSCIDACDTPRHAHFPLLC